MLKVAHRSYEALERTLEVGVKARSAGIVTRDTMEGGKPRTRDPDLLLHSTIISSAFPSLPLTDLNYCLKMKPTAVARGDAPTGTLQ